MNTKSGTKETCALKIQSLMEALKQLNHPWPREINEGLNRIIKEILKIIPVLSIFKKPVVIEV